MNCSEYINGMMKIISVAKILLIEQLREPTALLWTIVSPSALYIFMRTSKETVSLSTQDYIASSSWFYAYVASSVAMFGLSFYLIGRRESGFVRSFIYQKRAIRIYLSAHFATYSVVSLAHASMFYLITRPLYGNYSVAEYLYLMACFYIAYSLFSAGALLVTLLPLKFTTASTVFSILSFAFLILGYLEAFYAESEMLERLVISPLTYCAAIFQGTIGLASSFMYAAGALGASLYVTCRNFRIQPVWSRY